MKQKDNIYVRYECYNAAILYIGCIMSLAYPSVLYGLVTQKQINRKIKIVTDVPHGTSKWSASFKFEWSKVKVTDIKTFTIWRHGYVRTAAPVDQVRQAPSENGLRHF